MPIGFVFFGLRVGRVACFGNEWRIGVGGLGPRIFVILFRAKVWELC